MLRADRLFEAAIMHKCWTNSMKRVRIFLNEYPSSIEVANELSERFRSLGMEAEQVYIKSLDNKGGDFDVNIVVGGDGTFLQSVRLSEFHSAPFIGINTGGLGFFQEIGVDEIPTLVHMLKKEEFITDEMKLIKSVATTNDGSELSFYAINEILIKGINSKVIHMDVYVERNFLQKFSGDGIIISTSVGSTAYNFSVGGAIVHPSIETMQMSPLAPISSAAYRSLLNPIVMPGNYTIDIYPETKYEKSVLIVEDGVENFVRNIRKIETTISNTFVNRLHLDKDIYWKNLKDKFI